jgi:Tol biopolymer transport system component
LSVIVCGTIARSSAGAPPGAAAVPTLLADVPTRICGFAQDGARVAWRADLGLGEASPVNIEDLRTRTQTRVGTTGGYGCFAFTLAGQRVLWAEQTQGGNTEADAAIVSTSLNDRKERLVGRLAWERGPDVVPRIIVRVASDAATLVFIDASDGSVCDCPPDRGVRRVTGRGSVRLPGVIGAYAIAASGNRVAILSDTNRTGGGGHPSSEDPSWAPDGSRIAFAGTPEGDYRFSAIEVVPADGGQPVRLTHKIAGAEYHADLEPDWSPDGSRIAFVRIATGQNDGSRRLFVMNADGSGQRMVTQSEASSPAWSPAGTKIAFVQRFPSPGIYVVNADGTGQRRLTTSDTDSGPDWSPDGSRIVFANGNSAIEVMNADGSGAHQVATGTEPAWSPDGTRIAFATEINSASPEVHIVNLDGSGDRRVASGWAPAWSLDERRLAVVDSSTKDFNEQATDIYLVPADGGDAIRASTATLNAIKPTLQIHDAHSGLLLARAELDNGAREVALSESFAAVLAADAATAHVSLYGRDGSPRGSVSVPPNAKDLSMAGSRAVFHTGKTIWLLDARTRKAVRLTAASATPIGLSIDGNRIAWAENLGKRARIRAVVLPAP